MAKECPQCGSQLPYDDAKFCPECGANVATGPTEQPGGDAFDTIISKPAEVNSDLDEPEVQLLTTEWLADRSKDELIRIIIEQRAAMPKTTRRLFDASKIPFLTSFGHKIDTAVDKYVRLPEGSGKKSEDRDPLLWRIKLVSANPEQKLLGIDLCGDVLIGRAVGDVRPDLDLTKYGGLSLGVSRRHALLRPTESNLFLIDLGSSNGTFRNGSPVRVGSAQAIRDRDVLSFGGVHFMVKFVIQPGDTKAVKG